MELAWQNAQRCAEQHYTSDQLAIIASAKSAEDVLQHLHLLQSTAAKRRAFRFYGKFRPFLESVAQYEEVLKIYSNSHMVVAILWGSIDLLLVVGVTAPPRAFANSISNWSALGLISSSQLPR